MMRRSSWGSLFVVVLSLLGGTLPPHANSALVIRDVTVIAMTEAPPHVGATVVLSEGRVAALGDAAEIVEPEGAKVIDGAGGYLIPGLWDMHVHVLNEPVVDLALPLLVANGITGVRDMNGSLALDAIRQLRDAIDRGQRLGPRIVAAGSLVDGPGRTASGPSVVSVATVDEAREAVRTLATQGADFIKVYNRLTPELHAAIAREAASIPLPFAGHVPHQVSAAAASDAGQHSIEHLSGVLEECSSQGPGLRNLTQRLLKSMLEQRRPSAEQVQQLFATRRQITNSQNVDLTNALFERFVANQTWQCPTLVSNRVLALSEIEASFARDERLRYVPASIRDSWLSGDQSLPWEDVPTRLKRYGRQLELVGLMQRAGVRLLAGTDLGVAHVYAGFSLHDELVHMVEAGLAPLEALRAATIGPAEYLGRLDQLGTIEVGKFADLVLLDANPLDDIRATSNIRAVFVNGRHLDRQRLDRLLVEAAARAATM